MRFVSLFAGVGGFDLAFERAGMTCSAQVELDAKCQEVLIRHWPTVPKFKDIHDVTGQDLEPVDLLVGGFPCQDYSVAGKRGGLAGDRGALWWQFHRLIDECRPEWVVGENVPGLLSSNGGRDFGTIVGSLVELGYGVVWRVLDAQYFGVPQRRRRVFIVGHSGGQPRPEILAFAEGCAGDPPPGREAGAIASGQLARSLGGVGGGQDYGANKGTLITAFSIKGRAGDEGPVSPTLVAMNSKNSHNNSGGHVAVAFAQNQRAEVHESEVALSLSSGGGKPGQGYPAVRVANQVRRLTPLECERLQGFPDNWTADQSDSQRYRQMGNAVAVPVAEWIGRQFLDQMAQAS